MDLKLSINVDELAQQLQVEVGDIEERVKTAIAGLAAQTHAKVIELVNQNLHSTKGLYIDNLDWHKIEDGVFVVVLKEPAMFIEEGLSPHSMCDDLLKKNPKISKSGDRYKSIPFGHDKSESQVPSALRSLEQTLKTELKKRKIPFKKIEKNADGSPKLGKLHELNIDSDQKGPTGIPYLQGVNIYQSQSKETGKVSRSIMTFRTVSDKHKALGRWFHPGLDPKHFFEQAFAWSQQVWENEILPEILKP
jgi:hypothetical protein